MQKRAWRPWSTQVEGRESDGFAAYRAVWFDRPTLRVILPAAAFDSPLARAAEAKVMKATRSPSRLLVTNVALAGGGLRNYFH